MALITCELWKKQHLKELQFFKKLPKCICDNGAILDVASNPVFYERSKHIEVNFHFIREKLLNVTKCQL